MSIRVTCPSCKTAYNLADNLVGKRVRCKKCEGLIPVRPETADGDAQESSAVQGNGDETALSTSPRRPAASGVARTQSDLSSSRRSRSGRFDDSGDERPRERSGVPVVLIVLAVAAGLLILVGGVVALGAFLLVPIGSASGPSPAVPVANPKFPPRPPTELPIKPAPDGGREANQNPVEREPQKPDLPKQEPPKAPPLAPVAWHVQPDPLPEAIKGPEDAKASIAVPNGGANVLFPTTPSPFVLVVQNLFAPNEVRQVWNLSTMKQAGSLAVKMPISTEPLLSPDGACFAMRPLGAKPIVQVWSLADGKSVNIEIDAKTIFPDLVDFTAPGQLLTVKHGPPASRDHIFTVWDVKTAKSVREFTGPGFDDSKAETLSPGRKYLATIEREGNRGRVLLYDVEAGTLAGALDVPVLEGSLWLNCKALAFSTDGKELAGLFSNGTASRLISWDLAKAGKPAVDHQIAKDLQLLSGYFSNDPVKLEWLPDRSGWLAYGRLLIDYESGALVYTVPADIANAGTPRRVLTRDHIALIGGKVGSQQVVFHVLPRETIDAEVKKLRAASAAVVQLPAPKASDWSTAKELPAPVGGPAWIAQPDAALPAKAKLGTRPILLSGKGAEVERIVFTAAVVGQAAVLSVASPAELSTRKQARVGRYDLASEKYLGGFDLFTLDGVKEPRPPLLADLCPDGSLFLVKDPKEGRRLDIWSLSEGKHLAGWLPYEKETDPVVQWAAFIDSERVLTLNAAGKLVLWKVPDCKAAYSFPGWRGPVVLSPGGKYLAAFNGAGLELIDAASGERHGMLSSPQGGQLTNVQALAFRHDGLQLAALGTSGSGFLLARWDMKTGKAIADMPVAQGAGELQWCGNDHLLLDQTLFDLKLQWPVVLYTLPGAGRHATSSPDGRHWFASSALPNGAPVLQAQTLPDGTATGLAAQVAAKALQPLLAPGMTVNIRVEGAAPPGDTEYHKKIADRLTTQLKARGLAVAEAQAQAVLVVQIQPLKETGQKLTFDIIGGARRKVVVPEKQIDWQVTLADSQGTVLWKAPPGLAKTPNFFSTQSDDIDGELTKQMWNTAAGSAGSVFLPQVLLRTGPGTAVETLPKAVPLAGDR